MEHLNPLTILFEFHFLRYHTDTEIFGGFDMTAKEHSRLVGIFLIVHSCLQTFGVLLVGLAYAGMGAFMIGAAKKQEEQLIGVFFFLAVFLIFIFSVVLILPQFLGGWKLLKEKKNARTWGIIGSIVSLLSFPFGTAAGVYGLWFLFGDVGKNYYLQNDMNRNFIQPPPPPNNWN
jgi:hypothetical protein